MFIYLVQLGSDHPDVWMVRFWGSAVSFVRAQILWAKNRFELDDELSPMHSNRDLLAVRLDYELEESFIGVVSATSNG